MIIQISSGQGPAECELLVAKLYMSLKKEFKDFKLIEKHETTTGRCWSSVLFSTEKDLSGLEGTVQWICQSPFRPDHKRKNWFADVSTVTETEMNLSRNIQGSVRFERFHAGGKGGQNVNKVETGVRLTHIPTGLTVKSTSERSQYLNRKDAMNRLASILEEKEAGNKAGLKKEAWRKHAGLVRGNPVRVYLGEEFIRIR